VFLSPHLLFAYSLLPVLSCLKVSSEFSFYRFVISSIRPGFNLLYRINLRYVIEFFYVNLMLELCWFHLECTKLGNTE
jgi:hypothetical protein